MPSRSKKQARLMAASAHAPTAAGYGGVPRKVGRDFNKADKGTGILRGKRTPTRKSKRGKRA